MKGLTIFSMFWTAGSAAARFIHRPNFNLMPRDSNETDISNPTWTWDGDLGKRQLYWVNKLLDVNFDIATARQMAQNVRYSSTEICQVKLDGRCLIGGCNQEKNMGLYLCNYRPNGMAVTCEVFGTIAEEIVDHLEKKDKDGMLVTEYTDPQVQAYSYWSEDPSWVTMYTTPCLETVTMS